MRFSPDGNRFATASADGQVRTGAEKEAIHRQAHDSAPYSPLLRVLTKLSRHRSLIAVQRMLKVPTVQLQLLGRWWANSTQHQLLHNLFVS